MIPHPVVGGGKRHGLFRLRRLPRLGMDYEGEGGTGAAVLFELI